MSSQINMKNQPIQRTIEDYINAYNNFDIEGMLSKLHSAIVFKNITDGDINLITNGLEEFKAQSEKATTFFGERKQTITDIQISGQKAEVLIDYHAVLAVDFPNGLKTGDKLVLKGKSIFFFEDDLIVSIEDYS